ncbi:MAG: hypothetical protein KGD64_04890 [Candidatus Heimdallarchaeota archaeon]|nr:hypothetical protein [Candidatus Heimdallarchaeota archaeon]
MKPLEINVSEGLYDYIQKLVDENNFESIESFIQQATFLLAELHGFGEKTDGKGLNDVIADLIISKIGSNEGEIQKVKTVVKDFKIPNKDLILESFSSSKFMFEDAIFASCQFAVLKQGNPPITKEEFARSLNQMEEAGILTKIQQGEKMMWKRNE